MADGDNDPQQFWQNLRNLMEEVNRDDQVRSDFIEDPGSLIRVRNLDVDVPTEMVAGAQSVKLSELLGNFSANEREAVLDAFAAVTSMRAGPDIGRNAIAVPIANVNVAANHNVAANTSSAANAVAAANALATANTTGATVAPHELTRPGLLSSVRLETDALDTKLVDFFDRMKLNEGRRQSLLKRALLDSDNIIESGPGGVRRARFMFRGTPFEVEGVIGDDISVKSARLLEE
jgi:hypothetical protein